MNGEMDITPDEAKNLTPITKVLREKLYITSIREI